MKTNYGIIPDKEIELSEIPNVPRFKIKNYLFSLFDPEIDLPLSCICLFYNYKTIKLDYSVLDDLSNELCWPKYFKARGSPYKVKLPLFITPKLAYFIGYFYADGSLKDVYKSKIKRNKYEHKLKVGDEFLIQNIILQKLFKELFNLNTKIRTELVEKGVNYYYIEINNKVIYRFITKIFELPYGPKIGRLKLPEIILKCPREIRKWFVRGVFDGDGETRATEYYKNKKLIRPRIRLHMKDRKFIFEIKELISNDFGIRFNGPYIDKGNKATCIQIEKMDKILKAKKEKLFIHPIKLWRLNKLCRERSST